MFIVLFNLALRAEAREAWPLTKSACASSDSPPGSRASPSPSPVGAIVARGALAALKRSLNLAGSRGPSPRVPAEPTPWPLAPRLAPQARRCHEHEVHFYKFNAYDESDEIYMSDSERPSCTTLHCGRLQSHA